MSRIMIAIGGNALGETAAEQIQLIRNISKNIIDLVEQGHEIAIAHGNGPQIGMLYKSLENMPLPECGAMTQGYIGFHLQNVIREELLNRNIKKEVTTVVTQVVVDELDSAFTNPNKPIGAFMSEIEANSMVKRTGVKVVEDSGRGYRRVVPSPQPMKIIESRSIQTLLEQGTIVIAGGGGGIPVIERGNQLVGVDAVIDKDLTSEKMAEELDMDFLFILTAVEKVAINYGKENQEDLTRVSVVEAKKLMADKQFAEGSMLPKVEAALKFVTSKPGRKVIITSLEKAKDAIMGKTGTTFFAE